MEPNISQENSLTKDGQGGNLLKLFENILVPTALISAVGYYLGWTASAAYYLSFGLSPSFIKKSFEEFLAFAWVELAFGVFCITAGIVIYRVLDEIFDDKKRKSLHIAFYISLINLVCAYTIHRGDYGEKVKWPISQSNIVINLNPGNYNGLSESEVVSILNSSFTEWESVSPFNFSHVVDYSGPRSGEYNLSFSSGSELGMGSGVLAVTSTSWDASTGEIHSANIVVY